jgi:hypothetical protein
MSMVDDIKEVVASQAKICAAKTGNLEREITRLTKAVESLTKSMQDAQIQIAVQQAKDKMRAAFWAILGGIISGIIVAVVSRLFA